MIVSGIDPLNEEIKEHRRHVLNLDTKIIEEERRSYISRILDIIGKSYIIEDHYTKQSRYPEIPEWNSQISDNSFEDLSDFTARYRNDLHYHGCKNVGDLIFEYKNARENYINQRQAVVTNIAIELEILFEDDENKSEIDRDISQTIAEAALVRQRPQQNHIKEIYNEFEEEIMSIRDGSVHALLRRNALGVFKGWDNLSRELPNLRGYCKRRYGLFESELNSSDDIG